MNDFETEYKQAKGRRVSVDLVLLSSYSIVFLTENDCASVAKMAMLQRIIYPVRSTVDLLKGFVGSITLEDGSVTLLYTDAYLLPDKRLLKFSEGILK